MTSPLAYINDACFDPRVRFGFSNSGISRKHISRMRSVLGDTAWGGSFAFVAQGCEPMRA